MPVSREQRIRQYLDLVTGGEGTESVLANMETMAGDAQIACAHGRRQDGSGV